MFPEGKVRPMIATISNAAVATGEARTLRKVCASASLETAFAGAGRGMFCPFAAQ